MAKKFIGRERVLRDLKAVSATPGATFIVIKGRRRIGKSRTIKEFGKQFTHYYDFSGLAPTEDTTNEMQLIEFSRQMARVLKVPYVEYQDWSDAFWYLGEKLRRGKTLLFFDELAWMGSADPTFLAKIKNFWDMQLQENPQLTFVVCSSASAWIEKNILSATGFLGRISTVLTLEPLSLQESAQFWPKNISAHEKLKVMAVTGGIPRYLEEVDPKLSAEANILNLCFKSGGLLVRDYGQIFDDLFLRDSARYRELVEAMLLGKKVREDLAKAIDAGNSGRVSEYLEELELAGFIRRDFTWQIQTGRDAKLSQYRLSDLYLRFYLKYIAPNLTKIARGNYQFKSLAALPGWSVMMGLQFESLVLANRHVIFDALSLNPDDIVSENPYFQRATKRVPGCQIDYMIQTRFKTLFVCEIKFSEEPIRLKVIDEVQQKIDRIKAPRGFSCRPVLIHASEVSDALVARDYFAEIIDFSDALK